MLVARWPGAMARLAPALLLLVVAMGAWAESVARPDAAAVDASSPITPIAKVRSRVEANPTAPIPVHVRGVVTVESGVLIGEPNHANFYIQDDTSGIFVSQEGSPSLRSGDTVDLVGVAVMNEDDEPAVRSTNLEVSKHGPPPPALAITPAEVLEGTYAGRLVSMEGAVQGYGIGEERDFVLIGVPGKRQVRAYLRHAPGEITNLKAATMLGVDVRATGICRRWDSGAYQLRLRSSSDLVILGSNSVGRRQALLFVVICLCIALAAFAWVFTLRRSIHLKTKEIRELLVRAEESSRLKSEFLANMSHEIRTPLNGILGMQELALHTDLNEEQREYVQVSQRSAESLLALLNEVLDLSKVEAGKLELAAHDFDFRDLILQAAEPFRFHAQEKNLELTLEIDRDLPNRVNGDPLRLRQILVNLLSNAVKFTERGEIRIIIYRENASDTQLLVHFIVRDTGCGVPAHLQSVIFEAFRQADGSLTRRHGGTGLGLAISAQLVNLMGGKIWVESEPAQGSAFHFTAELQPERGSRTAKGSVNPAKPAVSTSSLRLLLVEDNEVNQLLVSRQMQKAGFTVTVAGDGNQALEALHQNTYDVVLMDVQMPDLDGLEATRRWREYETEQRRPRLPIIGLTAFAMKSDRDRCMEAGMSGYLSKPVRREELLALIRQLTADEASRIPSEVPQG